MVDVFIVEGSTVSLNVTVTSVSGDVSVLSGAGETSVTCGGVTSPLLLELPETRSSFSTAGSCGCEMGRSRNAST